MNSEGWKKAVNFYVSCAEGWPSRCRRQRLQRESGVVRRRPLRQVGRRHGGGGVLFDPKRSKVADKVGFAEEPIEVGRAMAGSGPGRWASRSRASRSRGQDVHRVGHIEGLHQDDRRERRLGDGACRDPQVDLRQPDYQKAAPFAKPTLNAIETRLTSSHDAEPSPMPASAPR